MSTNSSSLKRIILIAALAILMRIAIVELFKMDYHEVVSNIRILGLPVLGLLSILLVLISRMTFWPKRDEIRSIGITLMSAVMINALLRVVDWMRIFGICEGEGFRTYENLCEGTVIQNFFNIPFLLVSIIVLLILNNRQRTATISTA